MKIIEQFVQGKAPNQKLCEDRIFASPSYTAIIDGVTSKSQIRWNGQPGGIFAADLLENILSHLKEDATAISFIEQTTKAFSDACSIVEVKTPADRIQACCVVYSVSRRELWFVGDCKAMVDSVEVANPGLDGEQVYSQARALFLECELAKGKTLEELATHDSGRDFILPLIRDYLIFANNSLSPYGYSVFNGLPIPMSLVHIVPLTPGPHEIALASDGYPLLLPSLEESEKHLRRLLEEDPMCFRTNMRPKGLMNGYSSFDDRSYIRFEI